jgi:hypothetical protein
MTHTSTTIKTLVQGFGENIRQLKSPQYKESQVRLQYIDRFWYLLGWDVFNNDQLPPQDVEVMVEPSMDSMEDEGLRSREPDYLFRVSGFPRFIVEAKKPAIDIDTDKKAIFQTKRYAWNATIPFAVLTDFEQFRLYDTTLKPIINEPSRGLVLEFKIDFQDYPAKWDEFIATFGRDAVAEGSLEKLRARIRKISPNRRLRTVDRMLLELRGDEPVDKVFLGYLETYRKHFARAIYHDNKKDFPEADTHHGAARLTEAVQRLIDRMVFMRVCEDRGIRQYGSLKAMLDRISGEGGDFYQALCAEFRELDREYNGYLFKYHFSESLAVSDDILADLIRTLYPPDGPWDFSAIGDDILGIVYEKFIGSVVVVKLGEADVQQKPEVRHANGVYYTPRFIVSSIIRRVVGPKIIGRSPMELLDVKILDPACGSGSFLVASFQYLIDHCLAAIAKDPSLAKVPATSRARKKRKDIAFKDAKGQWQLAPDFKAALLTNCIHGVDIDQQAVEVTVMSLYLKMLEGKLPPHWQRDWLEKELLPPLDNNILCGNSLINSADFDRWVIATHGGLFPPDDEIRFRMNRFDWDSRTRGFGWMLDSQAEQQRGRKGFDCIIGNPPYIRVQELNKWAPDECEFYKWRYKSAAKGNYDIYVVFVERCLELLAPDGLLGFITPHKYLNKDYAAGLRGLLAKRKSVREIIYFNAHQVFQGVTTYTAISILQGKPNTDRIRFTSVEKLDDGIETMAKLADSPNGVEGYLTISLHRHPENDKSWVFTSSAIVDKFQDLPQLGSIADVFVGIQTDADDIYYLELLESLEAKITTHVRCQMTGRTWEIERNIIRPLATGSTVQRYTLKSPQFAVVFPFEPNTSGRWSVMSKKRLTRDFPLAANYFFDEQVAARLKQRAQGKLSQKEEYWDFIYRKNLGRQHLPKMCVPRLAEHVTAALDLCESQPPYCLDNVDACGVVPKDARISLYYLTGLLNSKLLDHVMRESVRDSFRGGYLSLNKQYLALLPIKIPETADEKKLADRIIELVLAIIEAKSKLRDAKLSDREQRTLEGDVENHERRIDELVFRLYGVKGLPN